MKNILLLLFTALAFATASFGQSNHPIHSASLSPNPVEGRATLTFDEPVFEEMIVTVKDLTGKLIFQVKSDTRGEACEFIRLDMLESLRRGIYILQVTSASGKIKTLKFQKT